jgi:fibronectin type 3 domain-containing protein
MKAAILRIQSNDTTTPTLNINLRGLGTASDTAGDVGGTNEPSLQRILNAFQIPVNVGDADGEATTNFPTPRPAGTANDEISMQRMAKAGAGPVVIQTLAAFQFNNKLGPVTRFGYYSPGTKDSRQELFAIDLANRTSTTPGGGATFDPGDAPFALYDTFNGSIFENTTTLQPRISYSEDVFNFWASTSKTKFRFFPLKNADGSVEPNAYVFATEDFDGTTSASFDSNDLVGIIRNVKPAGSGPEIGTQNLDRTTDGTNVRALPPDVLSFNRIQNDPVSPLPDNVVHDTANLRIRNSGDQALTINSITLGGTSPGSFQITSAPAAGAQIAAGGFADVTVKFIATSSPNVKNATLIINSNDADEPTTTIKLNGFWQNHSENNEEPTLVQTMSLFGWGTTFLNPGEVINQGGKVARVGDEVLSPYWKRFDPSETVELIQLSSYHTQGNTATVKWHLQGSTTTTNIFISAGADGQSVLPHLSGGSASSLAAGAFRPSTTGNPAFGFRIDTEWSDDTKNPQEQAGGGWGHHVRFWVAKDASGKVIPGTYIMAMDYAGINYDYNDNVYLVRNIQPISAPLAPTGASATASGGGIFLNWNDSTEANLAGYNVYRGTSSTFTPSSANKVNTTGLINESDFNDIFAPSGTTTFYAISAVDTTGNESGFTRVSATRTSDTTPPAAPANLSVMGSASAITLDWDNNAESDLAGYNVSRSTSANGTFSLLNTGGLLTTSSYIDGSAADGVTYFYRVVAVDQSGNSSTPATGSGTRGTVTVPAAPANLVASGSGATTASLTWSPSTGATNYRVERKGPDDADFVEIAASVSTTSFGDTGLTPSTAYQYRVRAENSAGLSGYSNVGTATTSGVGQGSGYTGTAIATTGSFNTITDGSAYDVTAGPGMINSTSDAFYFVSKEVTGDFDVKVRVDGIVGGNSQTRGGIMARATNDPNSAHVYVAATLADGFKTARRILSGADTALTKSGTTSFPNAWVRLQRVGNQITTYYGSNGTSWTQIFSLNIVLPQTLQLGLATGAWTTTTNVTVRYREFGDTNPQQPQLPGAPSGLTASAPSSDTVDLSWVAGSNATSYRIERRIQGAANFTQIASNVTGTTFHDTGRAANTTYEYQVRAENSAGLSGYSNVASVTTPDTPPPVDGGTYEAENAVLFGAQVATGVFPGYTGSGFVDYINPSGDYVEFQNVTSASTGTRTLRLRYALQAGSSRTLSVTVNGASAGTVTFTPTSSWTDWRTTDISVPLNAGSNTIRLTATGQSGPNFDNLTLVTSGINNPPPDGGTFQGEAAVLSGAVQSTEWSGFTGTGYADYVNPSADFVEFQNVPSATAGNRTLRFRFANGGTTGRTLNLTINGISAGTVTFAPTGSWTTWTTIDVTKALAAGDNVIRLTASGQSGPNLDSLTVL